MKPEEVNASLSSSYHCGEVLIEDDSEYRCGKGGVGKIIHHPAEDLAFLGRKLKREMGGWGDEVIGKIHLLISPYLLISLSPYHVLYGTDLLAHKNEITDPKAENGDGHNRNQMGKNDQKAL